MVDSQQVEETAEDSVAAVQDGMGGFLGEGAAQARDKVRAIASRAQGYYGDGVSTVRDVTSDRPLIVLLVAALLGFVAGAAFARR